MTTTAARSEFRLGFVALGVPWFDAGLAARNAKATFAALEEGSWALIGTPELVTTNEESAAAERRLTDAHIDALVLQIGTFPEGDAVATLVSAMTVPIVLVSVEESLAATVPLNSTCGAMMTGYILRESGRRYLSAHINPEDRASVVALLRAARTALAVGSLVGEPLVLAGEAPPGFLPCVTDLDRLQTLTGLNPISVSIDKVLEATRAGSHRAAPRAGFPTRTGGELDATTIGVIEAMYGALSDVLGETGARIAAVRDWPELLLGQPTGSAWPALGWLQEDGWTIGPERDVNGTVTLALERNLTGEHGFLGDLVKVDERENLIAMWHYGAYEGLASPISTLQYSPDGREIDFWLRPGRCAVARLGWDRDHFRLVCFDGVVTDHPARFGRAGCYLETASPVANVVHVLRDGGFEHHLCLSYGITSADIVDVARLLGIEAVTL